MNFAFSDAARMARLILIAPAADTTAISTFVSATKASMFITLG
jgi:hypothetical protein